MRIYHNTRCSKSRATLDLLTDNGVQPEIINYLETPPTADELRSIIAKLGVAAADIVRFGEATAKELGLKPTDERSDAEWLQLLTEHPILIERPIVVADDRAVIGRPPENILNLLD